MDHKRCDMALMKLFKSSVEFITVVFKVPSRIEWIWVGKRDPHYRATATRTLIFSVIAYAALVAIDVFYKKSSGHSMASSWVYAITGTLSATALLAAAFLAAPTWKNSARKLHWFLCHGIFAFFGGIAFAHIFLFVFVVFFFFAILKFFLSVAFHVDIHPTSWIPNMDGLSSAVSQPTGNQASDTGPSVESQDMFNDELKQKQAWGPDQTLVHDESQDSIYGNTYVDKDSGKEYRVTETDAFGHPTKVEEKW